MIFGENEMARSLDNLVKRLELLTDIIGMLGPETDNMLRIRDGIQDILDQRAGDPEVEPYRARVARIDAVLRRKAAIIARDLDTPARYRQIFNPPPSRWWWYLDEMMAERRRAEVAARMAVAPAVETT